MPHSFGHEFRTWLEASDASAAVLGVVSGGAEIGGDEKSHFLSRSTSDFSSSIRRRLKDLGVVKSVPSRADRIEISRLIDDGITVGDLINRVAKASSLTEGRYESEMDAMSRHADPSMETRLQEPDYVRSRPKMVRHLSDKGVSEDEADKRADAKFGPKKTLIIMRGVSGSGKSTLARKIASERGGIVLSTDDFFEKDGKYEFDPRMLPTNHKRNQARAEEAMKMGASPIIIDNTNTQAWEMRPYATMAVRYGYEISIMQPGDEGFPEADFEEIVRRQLQRGDKSLPPEVVRRMMDRFEPNVSVTDLI